MSAACCPVSAAGLHVARGLCASWQVRCVCCGSEPAASHVMVEHPAVESEKRFVFPCCVTPRTHVAAGNTPDVSSQFPSGRSPFWVQGRSRPAGAPGLLCGRLSVPCSCRTAVLAPQCLSPWLPPSLTTRSLHPRSLSCRQPGKTPYRVPAADEAHAAGLFPRTRGRGCPVFAGFSPLRHGSESFLGLQPRMGWPNKRF